MIWVAGRSPTLVSQNLKATTLTYLAIGARVIPVIIQGEGIPVPDRHQRTIKLIQKLNRLDVPESAWVLGDDGVMRPFTAPPSTQTSAYGTCPRTLESYVCFI